MTVVLQAKSIANVEVQKHQLDFASSIMTRIPLFLVPAFAKPINKPFHLGVRAFSVTVCCEARHKNPRKDGRDSNKERGVSAMRSTGPRHRLGAQNRYKVLPEPRDLEEQKREAEIDLPFPEKHGLLGFFEKTQDKVQPVISELDEEDVGRWWKVNELQSKSFDDLHALHWKCLFEINRVKTRGRERARLRIPSAAEAAKTRLTSVSAFEHNFSYH